MRRRKRGSLLVKRGGRRPGLRFLYAPALLAGVVAGFFASPIVLPGLGISSPPAAVLASSVFQEPLSAHDGGSFSAAHEASEGFLLTGAQTESVKPGARCSAAAPRRSYAVAAIEIDMTLNRYLDHDPNGRMYVLEDAIDRVRKEEARNANARSGLGEPAVSLGLQGDAIQPLVLRVLPGECLEVQFRNGLRAEPASVHLHGSGLVVAPDGSPAIATNAKAIAGPAGRVNYEWMVPAGEPEGTHYFHSHGDERNQAGHGLFGAVIVEPPGSTFIDPVGSANASTGWEAMVQPARGHSFREFALFYHEVGDEDYQVLAANGQFVPQVDALTSAYRPSTKALNYRSEPFLNRLQLQQDKTGNFDESGAYSSYVFGDPATPIFRSYVGDPTKQRIIHGGSEVFHVHHVHGGSIRWLRQPGTEDSHFDSGLDKQPPLHTKVSERTDSQSLGPSETFDIENECGSGGCQQSVGDYLFHCHVAEHYFAGMWGLWRVYNTRQEGQATTDSLPPLKELPDRQDGVRAAVSSSNLIGTTVQWNGEPIRVTAANLSALVEVQLPPRGVPKGYDASVFDWDSHDLTYVGEPEGVDTWPGYSSPAPGQRPVFLFDPNTGRLAYPFLRPHLGKRPPFAPNHGPTPFLDPTSNGSGLPPPGASGPASLCPAGKNLKSLTIRAVTLPVTYNAADKLLDPQGELFVLEDQLNEVRASNALRTPLAIRANASEDCLDVTLKSELEDSPENHGFSKVDLHIHFVQFDVQASDGVDAGFNYEQTIRPYRLTGEAISVSIPAGTRRVDLASASRFQAGAVIGVGVDQTDTFEVRQIAAIEGNTVVLAAPLAHAHSTGEIVSTEFVRYRWYVDAQFGTAYFHDHVNALASWKHGLYGALIAEPPGSTYHDPHTGRPLASGPLADIHTDAALSVDVQGSFREFVAFLQDNNPVDHVGRTSGSAINLRVEPLAARNGPGPPDLFSSRVHGDPATPLVEAYAGDPIVFRLLVGATNDVHTFHVDGHWFRQEVWSKLSPPVSTVHLGISERLDLAVPSAGGPEARAGDYLYYSGQESKLREGSWGILRVRGPDDRSGLQPLPGRAAAALAAGTLCPSGSPPRRWDIGAINLPLPMLDGDTGRAFVLTKDRDAILARMKPAEPLVLHANAGDCLQLDVANQTAAPVALHADQLAYDPAAAAGVPVGRNPSGPVPPGKSASFQFYASPEVGETVALLRDWGDVVHSAPLGLYGAIVIGPPGATYSDPHTGADLGSTSSWDAVVHPPGRPAYRDFTLLFQDEDDAIGTHRMPYTKTVAGAVGINYQSAPVGKSNLSPELAAGRGAGAPGLPKTPLIEAFVGDPVQIHVVGASSEQNQVFSIEGHEWPLIAGMAGSSEISALQFGGLEVATLQLGHGAGGETSLPGDYIYGDHRGAYFEAGLWGIFRVHPPGGRGKGNLRPLEHVNSSDSRLVTFVGVGAGLGVLGLGMAILMRRRKQARF